MKNEDIELFKSLTERIEIYKNNELNLLNSSDSLLNYYPGKNVIIRQLGEDGEIESEKEVIIESINYSSRDWDEDFRKLYDEDTMTKVLRTDYYHNEDWREYDFDGDIRITKYEKEVVINKEDVQNVKQLNEQFDEVLDRYIELSEKLFQELEKMKELDEKIKEAELNVRYEDEETTGEIATCNMTWREINNVYGRGDEDEEK